MDTTLNQEITIIYPPTIDWFFLHQRPQQLLKSFSKIPGVRSIFISSENYRPLKQPVLQLNDDLFIVKNNVSYQHLIKGKSVLWFSYPAHYTFANTRKFDFVVFDAIDNPADEFSFWADDLRRAASIANIISCTADVMFNHHTKTNKPVFMCPNGTDYDHFVRAQEKINRPADLPIVPEGQKVVGFYGAMASWVDFELIEKIANHYKVVLIGNNKYYNKQLHHPNITSLDHKDYGQLPDYLSNFDLTMVPFKLTEMIEGCDPIKFYEFLSAGKPVLATEMTELKKFSEVTYFIDHNNFLEVIEKAIAEDGPEKKAQRIAVAQQHSWDARARVAVEQIRKHLF